MKKRLLSIMPADYVLVLQYIGRRGQVYMSSASESLRVGQKRMEHIIKALRSKGLISVVTFRQHEVVVRLNAKGRKITALLVPSSQYVASAA